tara:strand:+ start:468 stop:926 length:459 start_codon:yes stop_codon:yes gene_type:complete
MYTVGQIIYSILEDKQILIPLQIVEQVITKNLEGEITQYKVLIPNRNKQKVNLDKFDKIFEDLDSASEYLLNNAKEAIDDMVLKAIELEDLNFKKEEKNKKENLACKNEPERVKIDLGDGLSANISPEELEKLNINNLPKESEEFEKEDITA